jgi:MinD superfamily P-loop ATPase
MKDRVMVFRELCHGCGACILACPDDALVETDREIGTISSGLAGDVVFHGGRLDVGEARVTPLIAGVVADALAQSGEEERLIIIDSPPGTSCSAIAAMEKADILLLVAEPTPFGIHDLELALELGRTLEKPMAVVVNRSDLGDGGIDDLIEAWKVPVLARIPFDRDLATSYAAGDMPVSDSIWFRERIGELSDELLSFAGEVAR